MNTKLFVFNASCAYSFDQKNNNPCEQLLVGGTGNQIEEPKRSNLNGTIVKVDPSPDMIRQTQEKIVPLSNVELVCATVQDYPRRSISVEGSIS